MENNNNTNSTKSSMAGYEKRKVIIDLYKHIGTISMALIVYINYLKTNDKTSYLPCIISFFVTILCSITEALILVAFIDEPEKLIERKRFMRITTILLLSGFFFGIGYLTFLTIT